MPQQCSCHSPNEFTRPSYRPHPREQAILDHAGRMAELTDTLEELGRRLRKQVRFVKQIELDEDVL